MSQSPGRLGRQYLGIEIYQSPIWNDIYLPVNCNLNSSQDDFRQRVREQHDYSCCHSRTTRRILQRGKVPFPVFITENLRLRIKL